MARTYTYTYSDLPCDHCRRTADDADRGPALWITDARPLDLTYTDGRTGQAAGVVVESNPGEPKLCDDCEMVRRANRRKTCHGR